MLSRLISMFYLCVFVFYFDFMPARFALVSNTVLPIKLYVKLADEAYYQNLKIRPITKNALVKVFNEQTSQWVSQYAFWTQLPVYSQQVQINPSFSSDSFNLSFEVLDTKTGKIYKTPEKRLWGLMLPKTLIQRLVTKVPPE